MTLDELIPLPDAELVALCAEVVMGWTLCDTRINTLSEQNANWFWVNEKRTEAKHFSPLYSFNHAHEVIERKRAEWREAGNGYRWVIEDIPWQDQWKGAYEVHIKHPTLNTLIAVRDPSLARAVVIAAVAYSLGVRE